MAVHKKKGVFTIVNVSIYCFIVSKHVMIENCFDENNVKKHEK